MNNLRQRFVLATALFLPCTAALADLMPDYYREPGLHPVRDYLNFNDFEYIDPFTGMLQHHYEDLVIPGNGGMKLVLQRSYHSPDESHGDRSVAGVGWQIHFGRVARQGGSLLCNDDPDVTQDNPVLHMPDGSMKLLVQPGIFAHYHKNGKGTHYSPGLGDKDPGF